MVRIPALAKLLKETSSFQMSVFAGLMGFLTYSSMYSFRKPFAAATFEGELFLGVDLKVWLILAQTIGYMASKFYGIKLISELKEQGRAWLIIQLVAISWLALLGFAVLPAPFNILCFLINGFPLGLIWGIVFHYMEGRKFTELMGSVLAASFVFSSGFVKSVGTWLMQSFAVTENWMPFLTGSLFFPLLVASVFLINHIPPPNAEDIAMRSPRQPMTKQERKQFFKEFMPGILLLILVYMMLTALRDLRDNFVVEIWRDLSIAVGPELLTQTEVPITLFLLVMMACLVLVKNNRRALFLNHWMILIGFCLAILATLGLKANLVSPFVWMVTVGTGVYMAYIPFNSILFDRLIAAFKHTGNVGFLMYLADSFGYLGSSMILVAKQFDLFQSQSWLSFYSTSILFFSSISLVLVASSFGYFRNKLWKQEKSPSPSLNISSHE